MTSDTLLPMWPLGAEAPATFSERLQTVKNNRAENLWTAVSSCLLDIFPNKTPRLRLQCCRAAQLCFTELQLPQACELGLVHLLIFSTFCKVGKSSVECTDGPDHPITVARLNLPVLYICPCGSHALHLETFVHGFMSCYEPQSRSDKRASEGKEIYTRDSATRLLEVLHLASQKTVSQLCAGKNALKNYKKGTS